MQLYTIWVAVTRKKNGENRVQFAGLTRDQVWLRLWQEWLDSHAVALKPAPDPPATYDKLDAVLKTVDFPREPPSSFPRIGAPRHYGHVVYFEPQGEVLFYGHDQVSYTLQRTLLSTGDRGLGRGRKRRALSR